VLSMKRYGWLCVLGGEVSYLICILGGYLPLRTVRGTELHDALLETLPGFVWGSPLSVILGAVYVFVFAWIFGAYMVWMHNTSLIKRERHESHSPVTEPSPSPVHSR
jgi:hypothetical protein